MDYEIVQATEANLGAVLELFRNDFARGEPLLSTMCSSVDEATDAHRGEYRNVWTFCSVLVPCTLAYSSIPSF